MENALGETQAYLLVFACRSGWFFSCAISASKVDLTGDGRLNQHVILLRVAP